jgi:hypothetical protein
VPRGDDHDPGREVAKRLPVGVSQLTGSLSGFSAVSTWLATNEAIIANGAYGLVLLLVLLFERDGIFGLLRSLGRLALAGVGLLRRRLGHRPTSRPQGGKA